MSDELEKDLQEGSLLVRQAEFQNSVYDWIQSIGTSPGPGFNLTTIQQIAKRLINDVTDLIHLDMSHIPQTLLDNIKDANAQVTKALDGLKYFNKSQENGVQAFEDRLIAAGKAIEAGRLAVALPLLIAQSRQPGDESLELAKSELDAIKNLRAEVEGIRDSAAAELLKTKKALEEASARTGVAKHAEAFQKLAQSNDRNAVVALGVAFVAGLLAARFCMGELSSTVHIGAKWPDSLVQASPFLLIELLLVATTIVGSRVFAAERHNSTLNRHRETALRTLPHSRRQLIGRS